jgi:hypothetical protein
MFQAQQAKRPLDIRNDAMVPKIGYWASGEVCVSGSGFSILRQIQTPQLFRCCTADLVCCIVRVVIEVTS